MSENLISLAAIFKNEEENLTEFLDSFQGLADEWVLVDTGSEDRSVEILEDRGIACHFFAWCNDFSKARNYTISKCTKKWILFFDLDDRICPEEVPKLRNFLESATKDAYFIRYLSLLDQDYQGKEPGILSDHPKCLLLKNQPGLQYEGAIHESPVPSIEALGGKLGEYPLKVYHLGYAGENLALKSKRNARIIHSQFEKGDRSPSLLYHYCNLNWREDQEILELLLDAFLKSGGSLHLRLAKTIFRYALDFPAKTEEIYERFREELSLLDPQDPLFLLEKARDEFQNSDLKKAVISYGALRDISPVDSSLHSYRFEIFYRYAFCLAASGDLEQSEMILKNWEDQFPVNGPVFHLRLKVLFMNGERNFEPFLQNPPKHLDNLDAQKKAELVKILNHIGSGSALKVLAQLDEDSSGK